MIDRIGNFRVIEELGRGGFGIVYGAVDDDLDRTVAIKLLTAPISAVGPDQDNLVREARLLAEMNHPYIATVYHLGFHQDQPYIVMEFVPDGLTDRMGSGGRLSAGEAVRIAGQVCEGLAYAHKRGVIHRDIKPQNILISEGGDVKIVDFGLARGANVDSLFSEGEFGGTPHYSAPEQFENDNVNAQADVYAVGILLYQMLSGQLPFQSDTLMTLYDKHKKGIPVPPFPADLDLPEWLQNIVERAVAKDRQQRYQSAGEMLADIEDGIELELAGGAATEPCPTSCQPPPPPSPRYARTSSIVVKAVREAVQQANRSRWGRMTTILTILSLIVGIGILSLRFSSLWSEVGLFEERGADNSPAVSDMTAPEAPAAPVGGMTLQQLTKATPRIPETSPAPTPEALRIQSAVEMLQQPEATVGKTFYSEPVQILINPDDGGLLTSD
jgi:serine/threonine protein kinase